MSHRKSSIDISTATAKGQEVTENSPLQARISPPFGVPERRTAPYSSPSLNAPPTHDDIARRAYDIYVNTGYRLGQCTRNWQLAEQSLREGGHVAHLAHRPTWDTDEPDSAEA